MNPLRWVAATRQRLLAAALIAYAVAFAAALPLSGYLRDTSTSPVGDFGLITLWLAFLAAGSLFAGILLADLVLPGRWRERVVLGRSIDTSEGEDDPALALAVTRSYFLHFAAIAVAVLAASAFLIETLTGGFFAEYQRLGYARATLRGPDAAAKLKTVDQLSEAMTEQRVRDALQLLEATWDDPAQPLEVRAAAVRSLARLGRHLLGSIDSWIAEGTKDHWEFEVVRELRETLIPTWRARLGTAEPALAGSMALALGLFRDFDSVPALLERVKGGPPLDATSPGARLAWREAVLAIGLLHPPEAIEPLTALAPKLPEPEDFTALAWAIGEPMRRLPLDASAPASYQDLITVFGNLAVTGPTTVHRCEAVFVLYKTRDGRIAEPLFRAFDAPGADDECPTTHVDLADRAPHVASHGGPFRVRVLQALAVVAVGQQQVVDWAKKRADDAELSDVVRLELQQLVKLTGTGTP